MDVLLATKNEGKITELREHFTGLPVHLRGLNEFPDIPDVEETGKTFAENATLKAQEYAKRSGLWALADDSGLEVFALGRAPGVYSARYGGKHLPDEQKMEKLLIELINAEENDRRARFVCVMAFANRSGEILRLVTGVCLGSIALQPLGTKGFGYDPIFIPNGFEKSFGEIPESLKRQISHRGRAAEKIIRYLRAFTAT